MPGAPEGRGGVVVGHAANDILRRVDGVDERPEAEEAPGDEEFEPDNLKVEVGEHGKLEGGVVGGPGTQVGFIGRRFRDSDDVGCVLEELHAEKGEEEANGVERSPVSCDGG